MANYFANSAIGPNISTIDANGPFWPPKITISFGDNPLDPIIQSPTKKEEEKNTCTKSYQMLHNSHLRANYITKGILFSLAVFTVLF